MTRTYEKQSYTKPPLLFATDEQIISLKGTVWFFDIELFENFLLIAMKSYDTGVVVFFEESAVATIDKAKLRWMIDNNTL